MTSFYISFKLKRSIFFEGLLSHKNFRPCTLVLLMPKSSNENYSKVTRIATCAVKGKYHTFIHPHKI
jgi:hypothetical protein